MPYITIMQHPSMQQISLEDILNGTVDATKYVCSNPSNTRTYYARYVSYELYSRFNIASMIELLVEFNKKYDNLMQSDRSSLYYTFHIPKKSGGLRRIDAPDEALMGALRELKELFETHMFAMYHTTAFAYVKNRCAVDAVRRHQQNESRWFAKLDFSNFFGSTTPDFVMQMFSDIFPFSEIVKNPQGREALSKALSLCFLNGGLPQGTPISPLITNIMMIPIDHTISNGLRKLEHSAFIYTRYADDIIISSRHTFNHKELEDYIMTVLQRFNAPFKLNNDKTRYGSSSGRNWNLGVMLNKDNKITIGYRKKKTFKAMVNNYILDKKNGTNWEKSDVQTLHGLYSYYRSIEREYIDYIIEHFNEKYSFDVLKVIKIDLKTL